MSSSEEAKQAQIASLAHFQQLHGGKTPEALARLQHVAEQRGNLFAELMSAVKVASLGQVSGALYGVGGIYRRNMSASNVRLHSMWVGIHADDCLSACCRRFQRCRRHDWRTTVGARR